MRLEGLGRSKFFSDKPGMEPAPAASIPRSHLMLLITKLSELRVLDAIAVLLLMGIAGFGVQRWTQVRDARRTEEAMLAAKPALGRSVDALVVSDEGGVVQRLSDVGAGKCRYIIIGTRTCPFARTAAYRWMSNALNDPAGDSMPEGWKALWVVAEQSTGRGDLFDPAFPSPTFYARDAIAFIRSVGMSQSPVHLVMDRRGVVIEAGGERRLLPGSAFRDDCTIAADPIFPTAGADVPDSSTGT